MKHRPRLRHVAAPRLIEALEGRVLLTAYYVSTAGSDANPGTALTAPLRTIQAAVNAAMPGDTVLVRGGTYRETVSTPRSGTAAARITIQNYQNEVVTVSGADVITGSWTSVGNEVYRAPMPWNYQFENQRSDYSSNQVFYNGTMIELARWPNQTSSDVVRPTIPTADSVTFSKSDPNLASNDLATFHEASFTDNPNRWVGAKIWVNLARNDTDGQGQTGEVVSATNGSITVRGIDTRGGTGAWSIGAGTEFYLFQPTVSALNATGGIAAGLDRGEWFVDAANGHLYVRTPNGAAPAANSVEAKRRTYGFNLDGDSYITIKGINLFGTTLTTDNLAANRNASPGGVAPASNILIDGMNARYVTHFTDQTGNYQMQWQQKSGLILSGTNITFQNGDVRLSAGSGLSMIGRQGKVLNSTFRDLNLQGSEAGMVNFGKRYDPNGSPVISEDHEFGYNTLSNSPQQGINFRALINSTNNPNDVRARIHHNVIHDVMLRSADSAAIDSFGVDHQHVRIDHNIIYNVNANGRCYGVYFDYSGGGIVDHNVIYNVRVPINFNWQDTTQPQNMRIYNNVGLSDQADKAGAGTGSHTSYGSIIRNNIFTAGIFAGGWNGSVNVPLQGATVSNNLVASNDLFVDPSNANMALRNYQLRNTATAAIDQGVSVAPYNDPLADGPDADTTAQPDIGAYEFNTTRWTAGAAGVVTPSLPAGWANNNIGNATPNGSASYNSSTAIYTVRGGGADIWGTSDQFQFASQGLAGDGTLSARVTSQTNTNAWAKAGVMIRASTAANSAFAAVVVTPSNGTRLQYRTATGAGAVDVAAGNANAYVRLVRAGANVRAFTSPNGSTWTAFGPVVNLGTGSLRAGLAVTSHNTASLSTATFANVSLTTQAAVKLTGTAIGTSGSYNNNGNTIAKVFDGNLSSHFDAPSANGAWVGLDLGASRTITQVKFAPRTSFASRMVGGKFQVSNSASFTSATTIHTIGSVPATGSLTTQSVTVSGTWRYVRYLSPDGSYGNIAEMEVHGF
jgi:hypothetical protein